MRFFRLHHPTPSRVILVESGSRHLLEPAISYFRRCYGESLAFDLVTCYAGLPPGLPREAVTVYPIHQFRGRAGRRRLYQALRATRPTTMAIICSGEPIMAKWKWALALHLPVKVLVINENGDFFWFDRSNWPTIRQLFLSRTGLLGADAARTIGQLLLFPFTLSFLLLYAAFIHLRRKVHA